MRKFYNGSFHEHPSREYLGSRIVQTYQTRMDGRTRLHLAISSSEYLLELAKRIDIV